MKNILMILTSVFVLGQTGESLRSKYGPPISETYLVREEVLATVDYDKSRQICLIEIVAPTPVSAQRDDASRGILSKSDYEVELLKRVAEELVPVAERGRPLISGFLNAGSPGPDEDVYQGGFDNYERVKVFSGIHGDRKVIRISWNDRTCER